MTNPFGDAGDARFMPRNPAEEEDIASLRRQLAARAEYADVSRMSDTQVRGQLANLRSTHRLPAQHAHPPQQHAHATATSAQIPAVPAPAVVTPDPSKTSPPPAHWIEFELLGGDDKGIAHEHYVIRLPDGREVRGTLNAHGFARVDGLRDPGACQLSFPNRDSDAWHNIEVETA